MSQSKQTLLIFPNSACNIIYWSRLSKDTFYFDSCQWISKCSNSEISKVKEVFLSAKYFCIESGKILVPHIDHALVKIIRPTRLNVKYSNIHQVAGKLFIPFLFITVKTYLFDTLSLCWFSPCIAKVASCNAVQKLKFWPHHGDSYWIAVYKKRNWLTRIMHGRIILLYYKKLNPSPTIVSEWIHLMRGDSIYFIMFLYWHSDL